MFIIVRVGLGLTLGNSSSTNSYGVQSTTYSLNALRASRPKPVNMDGRIAVHREVITGDLDLRLERASDIAMSDYKTADYSRSSVEASV